MLKDIPVLEIDQYVCRILNYDLLPISLRYSDVNFDDVMHGWTENRTMNIGKTNAKKILAGFKISQSNPYLIAKLFHFTSLSDCYWTKEEEENITWNDVSLFQNELEQTVTATALFGSYHPFPSITSKIHTPELTAQGMAAKAWIRETDGLYLYKIGKKELAASNILDTLNVPHVAYTPADDSVLHKIASKERLQKIKDAKEEIVKCKIISSEQLALVPWEDFQMYCAYHDMDEFEYIRQYDPDSYYTMQIVDYILGNEDRHGANFGFFMDNQTGKLLHLYPLMDHDHAFSNDKDIPSQTSEMDCTLFEAARDACKHIHIPFHLVANMKKPIQISDEDWAHVLSRCNRLLNANSRQAEQDRENARSK